MHARGWLSIGWKCRVRFTDEIATFRRAPVPNVDTTGKLQVTHAYPGLTTYLENLPKDQKQVALSFEELGKIMGRPLPPGQTHSKKKWRNTKANQRAAKTWLIAGWSVEDVHLHAAVVVFRRTGTDTVSNIRQYVRSCLGGKPYRGAFDGRLLIEWLKFCCRNTLYFEGAKIYEANLALLPGLSEAESASVEEDYAVCQRELYQYKKFTTF